MYETSCQSTPGHSGTVQDPHEAQRPGAPAPGLRAVGCPPLVSPDKGCHSGDAPASSLHPSHSGKKSLQVLFRYKPVKNPADDTQLQTPHTHTHTAWAAYPFPCMGVGQPGEAPGSGNPAQAFKGSGRGWADLL